MMCLNLCDLLDRTDLLNDNIQKLIHLPELVDAQRIYIGSYFCSKYFLGIDFAEELKCFLKEHPKKITLVVPISSEKDLLATKKQLQQLLNKLPVDEVTVNDVGMLTSIHKSCSIRLNLGRLFFKDARDIRLPEFYKQTIHPAALDLLNNYFTNYPIGFAEFDPISSVLDLQTNSEIGLALHEPFGYLTTGNICKYSSIGKSITQKFRPNATCNRQCQGIFEVSMSKTNDYTLYRIGRAVYFETERPQTVNGSFERYICFPFHQIVKLRKEGVSV